MKTLHFLSGLSLLACLTACSDEPNENNPTTDTTPTDLPEWYYAGGKLGTTSLTTSTAFEQPTAVIEQDGFFESFKRGEQLFEKNFMTNTEGVRSGLGPVYIRSSCIHCHPGYGHGKRVAEGSFETNAIGNGCLLVVYNPQTDAYVSWLAGMPQGHAVTPFKAPIDESQIKVTWKNYQDQWGNRFPDGETYELQYPEVTMPKEAIYVVKQGYQIPDASYEVRLESTIGIYGTGLLDAISDEDLKAEYARQEKEGLLPNGINPAFFKNGEWVKQYSNSKNTDVLPGTAYEEHPFRFTYALSRGPLQDAAGVNAMWNITNVTRSNRRYHYLDAAGTYASYSSKDPEVQTGYPAYINQIDPEKKHPEWHPETNENGVEGAIYAYLTSKELDVEMSDEEFVDFIVWHRGLAVPAVRNVHDETVQRGKEKFEEIGCTYCHKPSWTTGDDHFYDPNGFFTKGDNRLPRYPNQTIWPYSDLIQHKLYMVNDIRTGWCRTTPLWGRGLHQKCTGSATADRLHDNRARNVIEAIMWHGNPQSDAYYTVQKFRELPKSDRDAIVKFIDAI